MKATVTRAGVLSVQVCVPKEYTDEQVVHFAEGEYPCGTTGGWSIRKEGSERLAGMPERNQCLEHKENCHIMLDA